MAYTLDAQLVTLPIEMQHKVFEHCSVSDLVSLYNTNHGLRAAVTGFLESSQTRGFYIFDRREELGRIYKHLLKKSEKRCSLLERYCLRPLSLTRGIDFNTTRLLSYCVAATMSVWAFQRNTESSQASSDFDFDNDPRVMLVALGVTLVELIPLTQGRATWDSYWDEEIKPYLANKYELSIMKKFNELQPQLFKKFTRLLTIGRSESKLRP